MPFASLNDWFTIKSATGRKTISNFKARLMITGELLVSVSNMKEIKGHPIYHHPVMEEF
jgi:hypothetical protein